MDNIIKETEQWKSFGICEQCRRQEHCTKDCTAKKKRDERKLRAVERAIYDRMIHGLIPRVF